MRLPALKPKEAMRVLRILGFEEGRHGKHVIMVNRAMKKIIPVPIHGGKDLKRGTLRSIIKQSGISYEEFLKLLKK